MLIIFCHSDKILIIGPKMPKPLHSHSSVQFGDGLLVIGGISDWDSQSAIYYFGCKAAICSWTTMDQKLSEPRYNAVAMLIPNSLADCDKKKLEIRDELKEIE